MKTLGLIGYPLRHSCSQEIFQEIFDKEKLADYEYKNFELEKLSLLPELLRKEKHLFGFNVTLPFKQAIFPYCHTVNDVAQNAGAVNTVNVIRKEGKVKLYGYNTDVHGFEQSLSGFILSKNIQALILGTGGASASVQYVLKKQHIPFQLVSRASGESTISYQEITAEIMNEHNLIIHTTPLGMFPHTETQPEIPYKNLSKYHFVFDLVYNPHKTLFLKNAEKAGAKIKSGFEMLHLQAKESWRIWRTETVL